MLHSETDTHKTGVGAGVRGECGPRAQGGQVDSLTLFFCIVLVELYGPRHV